MVGSKYKGHIMKTSSIAASILIFLVSTFGLAQAATVEVTFTEPESYVDMRAGEKNSYQFKKDVFYNIEKLLTKLAAGLPEEQVLKIEFTDIDLAGDIDMFDARLFRVVKSMYPPRLAFNYQLLSKDKSVLMQGDENIRDTGFMMNASLRYKNEMFGYEKQLLEKWFKASFIDQE